MVSKIYFTQYYTALVALSFVQVRILPIVFYIALILPALAHHQVVAEQELAYQLQPEYCGADLESKFLSPDGKCPYSGLVPVKGSCTEYIPCISFGAELVKPLKRTECPYSAGLGFDIEYLHCRPMPDFEKCLQKVCYSKGQKQVIQQNETTTPTSSSLEVTEEIGETTSSTLSSSSTSDPPDEILFSTPGPPINELKHYSACSTGTQSKLLFTPILSFNLILPFVLPFVALT